MCSCAGTLVIWGPHLTLADCTKTQDLFPMSSQIGLDRERHLRTVRTAGSGDVTDDVDLAHGDLPVGPLLAEAERSALLTLAGVALHAQEHRALRTQDTHTGRR